MSQQSITHFASFSPETKALFHLLPETIGADDPILPIALGGFLYTPSIKDNLLGSLRKSKSADIAAISICLEDATPHERLEEGEDNLINALTRIHEEGLEEDVPLLFVRVRTPQHLRSFCEKAGVEALRVLTGFVFPKFTLSKADAYMVHLDRISAEVGKTMRFMPVLESPSLIHEESALGQLIGMKDILFSRPSSYLMSRMGATDLSSVYGVRRNREQTIYDLPLINNALMRIVNVLGRGDGHYVSGAVFEHFESQRLFVPTLRRSLFQKPKARTNLIHTGDETFIREVTLDKANGITGKTVIHPRHARMWNILNVVTYEDYCDATDVLRAADSGVIKSSYGNKMNEISPHTRWAQKIADTARVFGVLKHDTTHINLLEKDMT